METTAHNPLPGPSPRASGLPEATAFSAALLLCNAAGAPERLTHWLAKIQALAPAAGALRAERLTGAAELAVAGLVLGFAGRRSWVQAWKERQVGSAATSGLALVLAAALGLYLYAVLSFLLPRLDPAGGPLGAETQAAVAAAVLITGLWGNRLERRAEVVGKPGESSSSRHENVTAQAAPATVARVASPFKEADRSLPREERIPASELRAGDCLRVRPGEPLLADGTILLGRCWVDVEGSRSVEEAGLCELGTGDTVLAGWVNRRGEFLMTVTRTGARTRQACSRRLLAAARESQMPLPWVFRAVSGALVPSSIALAALTALFWGVLHHSNALHPTGFAALVPAFSVLAACCPAALALAAPLSVRAGTDRAAREGIFFSSARAISALRAADTWVFERTGTLTRGEPALTSLLCVRWPGPKDGIEDGSGEPMNESLLLGYAAALESRIDSPMSDPLARAVLRAVRERAIDAPVEVLAAETVSGFERHAGLGLTALIQGRKVALGNQKLMEREGVHLGVPLLNQADLLRLDEGQTVLFLSVDGAPAAILGFRDPLRAEAASVLGELKRDGIRAICLTGDHQSTAHARVRELGPEGARLELETGLGPQEKRALLERLKKEGRRVALIRHNPQDSERARADAVGAADDWAVPAGVLQIRLGQRGGATSWQASSCAISLARSDLMAVSQARALSGAIRRNLRQNLGFAAGYHVLGLPFAAGALAPLGLGLPPLAAALLMTLAPQVVIRNAQRLES